MSAAYSEKSPNIFWVYFFALVMALSGGLLGFAYLASFPAQSFSSEAGYAAYLVELEEADGIKEPLPSPRPGEAYFIEGAVAPASAWESKRALLSAQGPQSVKLSAGEINAWMSARFRPAALPRLEKVKGVMVIPGVPNVAFADEGTMYLNIPTEISAYGTLDELMISARCSVSAAGLEFHSVQVDSAKVPMPGLLGARLLDFLARGYRSTEEYKIISDAFARADSIRVEGGSLVVKLR